jgi:hypothetical protein
MTAPEETAIAVNGSRTVEQLPTNKLALWAYEARQAHSIAQSLAGTTFVPQSMKGNVGDITGAILAGAELGMQPIAALRSIDVIQGTPALRAIAMRGLVQNQGHEIELLESTATRCVMRGRRAGAEKWQTVEWTIERAQQMGLTAKQQWKLQPTAMLIARCTGELCRLIAADVLLAMPYSAEELITGDRVVTMAEVSIDHSAPAMVDPRRVTLEEISDKPHRAETDEESIQVPSTARRGLDILESQAVGTRGPLSGAEMLNIAQQVEAEHQSDPYLDSDPWPETAEVGGTR